MEGVRGNAFLTVIHALRLWFGGLEIHEF